MSSVQIRLDPIIQIIKYFSLFFCAITSISFLSLFKISISKVFS